MFLYIATKALTSGEKINKANLTSESYNLNENESYEEEEIDVFEKDNYDNDMFKTVEMNMHSTANPIALIVLSLFTILIVCFKNKL